MNRTDPWFDSLYEEYVPKFFTIALELLDNWAVAEEIVQDVFVILLLCREKIEIYEKPRFWLLKVLRNRIGNELQRMGRQREFSLGPEYEELLAGGGGEFDRLEYLLPAGLDPKDRQVLIWFYEDNLDFKEIGRRLHRTPHACETRLYRARNRCRELLQKNK